MAEPIRNIAVLSVDALRADHLPQFGYERETAPTLEGLSASGVHCTNAVSASTHTREAMPAMLSGQHAADATDGSYELRADTVASLVGESADTGFFHSNPFVSRAYGFDEGFDAFDDDLRLSRHKLVALAQRALDKLRNRHYARAEEINERSLSWLDSRDDDRPFLLWNHYMDVHGPYEPPSEYAQRWADDPPSDRAAGSLFQRAVKEPETITDEERQTLVDLYDGEIRYTDDQIRAFLDGLEARGLLEETLVIVTSDHGEAFGERGYFEHPRFLDEELLRVPLILDGPEVEARSIDRAASVLDVVPTALNVLGVGSDSLPGVSLLSNDGSDVVISSVRGEGDRSVKQQFSARSSDRKLVREYDVEQEALVEDHLYAVSDGVAGDAVDDRGEEAERVRETLDEHVATRLDGLEATGNRDADEQVQGRLQALGYVDE
ncbi:sulfatase-like hydrolase/transferase [Haloarcula laminariae]|uniref:sulfatase-like hydrolase/transferase n=1 Tax=Haloarcula laminariae TaxID=2961577 RepID=UPI0024059BCC|nr:sulfatase-like hydrolase/transferase [Halomicroarcula sp. FL173]